MELDLKETLSNSKKAKGFRLQGKNLFLTYPKCLLEKKDVQEFLLSLVGCDFMLIARELHLDGTPHIHVFLTLKKKMNVKVPSFFDIAGYHGNYQTARDSDDVIAYINKSDKEPLIYGEYVGNSQTAVQKRAIKNKQMLSMPTHELVDTGLINIVQYKQVKEAIQMYQIDKILVPDYMPKTCIWIYGATGIGKSRYVRDNHPGAVFFKSQNKWWCGYNSEKIVLIDDFDMGGQCLGHYLKIWGDCYSFNAEIKGSNVKPVFDMFYITSQYLPREIWCPGDDQTKWDEQMREAIERRFKVMTVKDRVLVPYDN